MNIPFSARFFFLRTAGLQIAALAFIALITTDATAQVAYAVVPVVPNSEAYGWAINKKGQVTGTYEASGGPHAFLYGDGTLTDLGTLGGPNSYSVGFALNDRGEVVGESEVGFERHAFLYSEGVMLDLSALAGGAEGYAMGVNKHGSVVCNFGNRAFLYSGGTMRDLGAFIPTCINDRSQIAGFSLDGVPVLYSDGKLTELGSLGGMSGGAYDINDRGQIAGASATGTGSGGAFVFSDGRMTSLGTTTNTLPYSMALGINNHGSVVGAVYDLGALVSHAFLYKDGQMIDLNAVILDDSGLVLDQAVGINDSGEIIASGNYGDGQGHGFLLKPVHRVGKKGTREAPDRVMPSTSEAQF